MEESVERKLHRAVGLSDLAALMAAGFSFPNNGLGAALSSGAFLSDWRASIVDACGEESAEDACLAGRCAEAFSRAEEGALRREYSRLLLVPGVDVPVWLYESPFMHRAAGGANTPALFGTRSALDVERQMAEAGVATVDLRREPVDSVFHEFEFLAHLHASVGEAVRVGDDGAEAEWRGRLASFAEGHALRWLPSFMAQVEKLSRLEEYRALADLGARYLRELAAEVDVDFDAACGGDAVRRCDR